mgnify:CR=1 FL=1
MVVDNKTVYIYKIFSWPILVGIGSFGLGRLSYSNQPGLKIEYIEPKSSKMSANPVNTNDSPKTREFVKKSNALNSGNYFASSRGKKYYSKSCGAGKSIKTENRVYFASAIEAQEAGYELASSCQ